ncbi:MAG: L-asparaginase [Alphaproteobacteria bacterium]|jgi:L-asparaginase|nr:L-asparaginase [Alphaproteobacteria bacterium]
MNSKDEAQKNVCLIYTGGTIGMERDRSGADEVLIPGDATNFLDRLKARDEAFAIAKIHYLPLMSKDSTNIVPADWTQMAEVIYALLQKKSFNFSQPLVETGATEAFNKLLGVDFDGFVIAHGTDTMHFSSSALAFAFGKNLNLPVVFTGAQTAPDVHYGDARVNLLRALKVATQELAEVVVAFGEFIFRGCRVQKKDEKRFDAFEAPAEFPIGYITEDILLSEFAVRRKANPGPLSFSPRFADGIVQISLIPGLRPELLLPIILEGDKRSEHARCKGVVLQSFGAGNVPSEGDFSFQKFIERAVKEEIPVVIASQFPANSTLESQYAPGKRAVAAGAIATANMTNAAATVKFRWVLHQIEDRLANRTLERSDKLAEIRKMMNTSYVGELTNRNQIPKE